MKVKDIPFEMGYEISDDLKEKPLEEEEMQKGLEFLHQKLVDTEEVLEKAAIKSLMGIYSRILGQLTESESYLKDAIDVFLEHKKSQTAILNELRLAITYQWKKNYTQAEEIFFKVINSSQQEKFHDFAYQHLGKCKFDQGLYQQALENFNKAHDLRLMKGDMELIRSTQVAIERTREALKE